METPKRFYTSLEEYETLRENAYTTLKKAVYGCVLVEIHEGLTLFTDLSYAVEECLFTLSHDRNWSNSTAWDQVIYGIDGFINGLKKSGMWDLFYTMFTKQQLAECIYNNIIWQLDDDTHFPCRLEGIAHFMCYKCQAIDDYVSENNYCINCEEM